MGITQRNKLNMWRMFRMIKDKPVKVTEADICKEITNNKDGN